VSDDDTLPRARPRGRVMPLLSPAAELAIFRQQYPDGLWCTSPVPCQHRLIATTLNGWAKSWADLPEPERVAQRDRYVCAECRWAAAERERVVQVRRDNALTALKVARGRRQRARLREASADPHKQRGLGGRFLSPDDLPRGSRRAGGRPRKHADLAAARKAARLAYRVRQKDAHRAAAEAVYVDAVAKLNERP
jgi:hypothetical protein